MDSGDLAGSVLEGRYQVLEAISRGAMGVVYRAERMGLGKIVAIKLMHDELPDELSARKRFEIEAMAMAKLEHPHCAAVLDVGVHEGRPFVVMDFVSGTDLKHLVEQGPVPIARTIAIMRQVLAGVAHAHELGIIHRDIKPANVMISQKAGVGDFVRVLDFGLARLQAEQTVSKLTTGIVVGTPAYMAPEQIRGVGLDARADLYSSGVLLMELLTARKPFESATDDPMEVVSMHLRQPAPRLDALLPGTSFGALEDVVKKALAKAPDDRYQTATEFAAALDAASKKLESGDMGEAPADGPREIPQHTRKPEMMLANPLDPGRATWTPQGWTSPQNAGAQVASPSRWAVPGADTPAPEVSPSMVIPQGETRLGLGALAASPSPHVGMYLPSGPVPVMTEADIASGPVPHVGMYLPSGPVPVIRREDVASGPVPIEQANIATAPIRVGGFTFSRTHMLVGGGVALVILIGIIAGASGGEKTTPIAKPTAVAPTPSPEIEIDPGSDAQGEQRILEKANAAFDEQRYDTVIETLSKAREAFPNNADMAYLAGKAYFAKLYWNDGLRAFRDAIRLDPAFRNDAELIKTVLAGYITTPSVNRDLATFLRDDIGAAAEPYLAETASDHPNANIRKRAADELKRY